MSIEDEAACLSPIDVSMIAVDERVCAAVEEKIRRSLLELSERFPQIARNPRRIRSIANSLSQSLASAVRVPDPSLAAFKRRLAELRIPGVGQANELWPWIFTDSAREAAFVPIEVCGADRDGVVSRAREALSGYFNHRPEELEWVTATLISRRLPSLEALYERVKSRTSVSVERDLFANAWAPYFKFGATTSAAVDPSGSPDWELFWTNRSPTAYGGDYPGSIAAFLTDFLSHIAEREPDARILDVGTGGHGVTRLARGISEAYELVGVDLAPLQPAPDSARVNLFRMNAERLAFSAEAFSAVVSVNAIEYADLSLALPEVRRVMRPGAGGAFVFHRPDSYVVRHASDLYGVVENSSILETLALAWMHIRNPSELRRRELERELALLEQADFEFLRTPFFDRLWKTLRVAIASGEKDRKAAIELVEWCENVLRWAHEKSRFLATRMISIPTDRAQVEKWVASFGFDVHAVEELRGDGQLQPLGWGIRVGKPRMLDAFS